MIFKLLILTSSLVIMISHGFVVNYSESSLFKSCTLKTGSKNGEKSLLMVSRFWKIKQDLFTAYSSKVLSTVLTKASTNHIDVINKGSIVALVTPFKSNGNVDITALRKLLKFHVISKTSGICILGTTGESSLLNNWERRVVLETVVEEIKGKIPIIAGTGSVNPTEVHEMTLQARDLGCDACLIVSPPYVKPPQRGLVQHFISIADLGLPVIIYNVPGRTGVDIKPESIALCATHENIVGVKDATGDISRIHSIRSLTKKIRRDKPLLLYSGDDVTSAKFVLNGGDGCISVTANVVPVSMCELMLEALQGNEEKVECINKKHEMLNHRIFCEANPMPVKWALRRMGKIKSAYCRSPLMELDEKYHHHLEEAMKISGIISMF